MTAQSFRRGTPTLRDTAHQATVTPATSPAEARSRLPLLTLVTLIALLTPAYFSVGPLVLTPSKTLFLVTVPVLMVNLFRGQYGRVNMVDILIFAYIFWMGLALLTNHSVGRVIENMGSVSLILLGGYLTGRATIRSRETFIAVIRFPGHGGSTQPAICDL